MSVENEISDKSISLSSKSQQSKSEASDADEPPLDWFGARHTLAVMGFLGLAAVYAMRVNLSVAIVAMVNKTTTFTNESDFACPLPDDYYDQMETTSSGEFDWDEQTQGYILGAFYYGYMMTNLIGGRAAEYFGGRLVVGLGIVLTGLLTMVSPFAARSSTGLFIAVRVLEGCTEGVTFPALNTLIADWYPPSERSKFATVIFVGVQFGTVVTLMVTGVLCDTTFLGGWPSVFYIFGLSGVVWGVFWFFLIRDDPKKHPRISDAELKYILQGCPRAGQRQVERLKVPWLSIFKSRVFWIIVIMHVGYNWGFYTLLSELPTYLDQILHFNIKKNGFLSSLPYLGAWIFSLSYSIVTDYLLQKNYMSILAVRKIAMVFSGYVPMVCLVIMCFVNCHSAWAMVILVISGSANGSYTCGFLSSHADVAPRYAGTLMGLTNTLATIPGFLAPVVTGALTQNNETLWAWRKVFLIAAVVYGLSTTVYVALYKTTVQDWNDPTFSEPEKKSCHAVQESESKRHMN